MQQSRLVAAVAVGLMGPHLCIIRRAAIAATRWDVALQEEQKHHTSSSGCRSHCSVAYNQQEVQVFKHERLLEKGFTADVISNMQLKG